LKIKNLLLRTMLHILQLLVNYAESE